MDLHIERLCPSCRTAMRPLDFDGIQLEECAGCGGVWFDDGEINAVRTEGIGSYQELEILVTPEVKSAPTSSSKVCPSCNLRLRTYRYQYSSPVELDECQQCYGVWVEDGELGKIYDYLCASSPGMASPSDQNGLDSAGAQARYRMRNIAMFSKALSLRNAPFATAR